MKKLLNGVEVDLTPQEEAIILAEWETNRIKRELEATPEFIRAQEKIQAKKLLDELLKDYAVVSLNELNRIIDVVNGIRAAVNNASGGTPAAVWADYKAKIAAIPTTLQTRTIAQLKTAIDNL